MISVLGRGLVLVGLFAASFGVVTGFWAGLRQSPSGLRWTQRAVLLFAAAMLLANLAMEAALIGHDFSVTYVAKVGSRTTPTWVTLVSLWSSLEGSILFWGGVLGAYVAAFTLYCRHRLADSMAYALAVMLAVGAFFALLLSGPADPFAPVFPVPLDGPGPNPLLQNHALMAVHPPVLYLGYVGMTVPFGIAMAAVLRGKLATTWVAPLRQWTMVPWAFLTAGILLGGWWAYEVLGWGGFWAWDPVENASFLPWLAATGYLHSTLMHERRRVLTVWTLALVIVAFLLTMLGTFMTRSGVFNSVHAFSQSAIGPLFLVFIAALLILSLGALAGRAHLLTSEGSIASPLSREASFLLNNLVLLTFTFTVLLGTLYPLVTEAVRGVKMSVGEPYFNQMTFPIALALVLLLGVGPSLAWGRSQPRAFIKSLRWPALAAALVALNGYAFAGLGGGSLALFALCAFSGLVTLRELWRPAATRLRARAESPLGAILHGLLQSRRRTGAYLVHVAVIMVVAAVAASHTYKRTVEASLTPGESVSIGHFEVKFDKLMAEDESHRTAVIAELSITRDRVPAGALTPALNFYASQREPVGAPAVRSFGLTDLYVSLLSFEEDGSRIAIKAFLNPMVPLLWWTLPLFMLGALLCLWPRRRSSARSEAAPVREVAA